MFRKIFLSFLCLFLLSNFGALGFGQENNTIRHYILLLDATGSFRKTTGTAKYFPFVKDILEMGTHKVHDDYLPYRPGSDIVSIVFFHFPINNQSHKIIDKGFYTSRRLVLIKGAVNKMQTIIENFVEENIDDFRELAVSPIGLSEVTVFPYVNEYIRRNHLTISNRVDKIYLISLSDEQYIYEAAGIKSALESFAYENDKRYYNTLRQYMKTHFKDPVKLNYIPKEIDSTTARTIHFHFYEIKPKIENIELNLTNKVALDRTAQKSADNSEPEMYWKGFNDICLDNQTGYNAWVEWALSPSTDDNGPWIWYRCDSGTENQNQGLDVLSAGCRSTCGDDPKDAKSPVLVKKRKTMWSIVEEVKRFKEEIWYRGVVDMDREKDRLSYPFNTRYYMTSQKVEYVSGEVTVKGESNVPYYYEYNVSWYNPANLLGILVSWTDKTEITDEILKEKLKDKDFCLMVKKYINKEKLSKQFKDYYDAFAGNNFSELPAGILSETSKINAMADENWGILRAWIILFLVAGLIIFVYLFYWRPIEIRFNIDEVSKTNNAILMDFSNLQKEKEVLAIFELENLIRTLYPGKKNPKIKFSFDMNCHLESTDKELKLIYEPENLLSILQETRDSVQEYKIKTSGSSFYATLPGVRFKQKFQIVLNLKEIKDIETSTIGEKIVTFTISLTSPEARKSSGKKLNISTMKIGNQKMSKQEWDYILHLHLKPETRKKEILINPIDSELTTKPGKYWLNYTSQRNSVKLFDVQVSNLNQYNFSYPVEGKFLFKLTDRENNPVDNIFYFTEKQVVPEDAGKGTREIPICLKKSDGQKNLSLYINFNEFSNPVDHNDYTINCYFDNDIVKTLNIRINRSKEETEALVQLMDEDEIISLDKVDYPNITTDNSLLVYNSSKSSNPVSLKIPELERKGIKEYGDTKLFTLRLKNNCNTGTGFYNWRIDKITAESDDEIDFQKKTKAIKLIPEQYQGKIQDNRDQEEEIEFYLDHKNVKAFHSYLFSFELKFGLIFELFPIGDIEDSSASAEKPKQKQLNFSIRFICYHEVKDNYLVVDFGTSAICAYYHYQFSDSPGDNYFKIPLKSPRGHMPSEYELLPSIINLRNSTTGEDTIIEQGDDPTELAVSGSEHFVDLPALNDILGLCPESVLSSIKLLIVQGSQTVPIPGIVDYGFVKRDFVYLDEKGKLQKGNPALSSVLKSCYESLLKNYIETNKEKRYRKVVLTYPNVYNRSHISFLEKDVFKDVFDEAGRVYFENITLESESNCVLYYYLSKRARENLPPQENVLVVDIGAGTLDMSYAIADWQEEMGVITPSRIEIVKRDGIAMAGDTLDKAIALQVHDILKKFTGIKDLNYANKIASNEDFKIDDERKMSFKKIMFDFKIKHILDFKKKINSSPGNDIVGICLGENHEKDGLCVLLGDSLDTSIEEGKSIKAKLINRFGKIFLEMKKQDWLNLPFLKRFENLLINKLEAFKEKIQIIGNLNIVLSGRTSLWPAVPQAVLSVFNGGKAEITDYIWPEDPQEKAIALKRAVILGAIQKTTTWREIDFSEVAISGEEAVRYQRDRDSLNPESWEIKTFKNSSNVTINLGNSSYFELGIKTSMDFVPFVGADGYKRDRYCKKDKKITITLEKMDSGKGYNFYVKSDKYTKGNGTRLPHILSHERAFLRTRARFWPVREVQLREITPGQFNENT